MLGAKTLMRKPVKTAFRWLLVAAAVVVGYYVFTIAAINYCAADLSRPSGGCVYLFWHSGHETRLLIRMGARSVPAVQRQLARTDLTLQKRIHFAWILSSIGDHSQFHTFIDGLSSIRSSDQWMAYVRMRDFPDQCARYFAEILAVRGERAHDSFWSLIEAAAESAHINDTQRDRVYEITSRHREDKSPLTEKEQHEILALLKPKA